MERPVTQKRTLDNAQDGGRSPVESLFLDIVRLVRRIAQGRVPLLHAADIPDIVQDVSLRLWRWSARYVEKSEGMTETDWNSFTARTVHNEINRYFSTRMRAKKEVPLDEAASIPDLVSEGNSETEIVSLINGVWQEICILSLHQRRSLLLHSPDLVIQFMLCGVETGIIAQTLGFSEEDWQKLMERLPLTDAEIAAVGRGDYGPEGHQPTKGAVKKARFDARKKLKRFAK